MKLIIQLLLLAISIPIFGQDTLRTLKYETFIAQVMTQHPTVFIGDNITQSGDALVMNARGEFDPKLFGDINQKYFKDAQYYSNTNGGIKIPTWFGVSAEAGYLLSNGVYLNPENRTPDAGLWYAGLRLELGQGLIIDKRRAELKKAKLVRQGTSLEQRILLNELKRDASIAYWKWTQAYNEVQIYTEALENARVRFEGIKRAAKFGDRPYIDTVEAILIVNNRKIALSAANVKYQNAELELEIYLWEKGFIPLELEGVIPSTTDEENFVPLQTQLDSVIVNHPYQQLNELKIQQNKIDLKLKREQLKPKLTLKYNALSEPVGNNPLAAYSMANYAWGASIAYPILSRKERGDLKLAKLKLENQELMNATVEVEINYKIRAALNKYAQAIEQFSILEELVENNRMLYSAELKLFNLGESSVFMVNSRENKLLKAQIEFVKTRNNVHILKNELTYVMMSYSL